MKSSLFFLTSDAKVLDLIRKGDEEALVALYESNRRPVLEYVTRNHGTADDAGDMLQDALVILWERVRSGRFEQKAKLSTFIYATVRNLWFHRLRRHQREHSGDLDAHDHPDASGSALDNLIEREQAELVKRALQKIGEQCRKMLLLF